MYPPQNLGNISTGKDEFMLDDSKGGLEKEGSFSRSLSGCGADSSWYFTHLCSEGED